MVYKCERGFTTVSLPVPQGVADEHRRIRLLIAEDDLMLRDLLSDLLCIEFDVVATASNGEQVLATMGQQNQDILLMDISMPVMTGFAVARRLRSDGNTTPIIFITEHAEQNYFDEARDLGANGYILKRKVFEELAEAIHRVAAGGVFISPSIRSRFTNWHSKI